MPPASARTRSPASGSSRAPARSPSIPAKSRVYFARPVLRMMIQQPLIAAARAGQYDVICTVAGGGLSGQAGAVRHGISKALTYFEPDLRRRSEEGRLSHARLACGRAQEVRPRQGAQVVPVLEALIASFKFAANAAYPGNAKAPACGRLFVASFADELTQFFLKTCSRAQTDCQRGGHSVFRWRRRLFRFFAASCIRHHNHPVTHVARYFHALSRCHHGGRLAGIHAAVLRQSGEYPGAEMVGNRLSAGCRVGGALDAGRPDARRRCFRWRSMPWASSPAAWSGTHRACSTAASPICRGWFLVRWPG